MQKENVINWETQLKVFALLAVLGGLSLVVSGCNSPAVRAFEGSPTPTSTMIETPTTTMTVTPDKPAIEQNLEVDNIPIGQIGEDIKHWNEIEAQTADFDLDSAPNLELIRALFKFKNLVQAYAEAQAGVEENPYQQGDLFGNYLVENLDYVDPVALGYLEDYYKNADTEDLDGNHELVPCMEAQIFASSLGETLAGAPVSLLSHRGAALALAADMLNQPDGAQAPDIDGVVIRYPADKFEINLANSDDTVAIRYGDYGGHVLTILGKAHNQYGELMVLVFDSNRLVTDKLVTNGIPQIRWMTSEEFSRQNETETSRAVGIRPSSH